MGIKALITGSTGMIGKGVLLECLSNPKVASVLVINRRSCGIKHPKLKELIHADFFDLSPIEKELTGYDACFFCLGVTVATLSESEYNRLTYELTVSIASTLLKLNKGLSICYISGAGSNSSGKIMWVRIKGKTEDALLAMPFKKAYMFRPAYIQPMKGVRSGTRLYRLFYAIFKPFYFALKPFKSFVTNTEAIGKAMINAVTGNYGKAIIESRDINKLAAGKF